jgi:hypothetical protein
LEGAIENLLAQKIENFSQIVVDTGAYAERLAPEALAPGDV